jgi:hypothetical protein
VAVIVHDDRGILEGFPQVKHRLHGQRRHVRFGPSLPAFLHNFFIFHPSVDKRKIKTTDKSTLRK